ncbi:MAG: FMN-binding protein [Persephonella sp.]|nr:FMN-binding protein [Persephonella sp.]
MRTVFLFLVWAGFSYGGLLIKPEEAIKELFPQHSYTKKSFLLGKKEKALIEKQFKTKIRSSLFTVYIIKKDSSITAYSLLHSHRVRTKKETVLITMNKECQVLDLEIIAFYEPPEYIPPEKWLNLFKNASPEKLPFVKRNIPNITGATLSSRVITDSVRQAVGICKYHLREKMR